MASFVLTLILGAVAWFVPTMLLHFALRAAAAFFAAFVLFYVVHESAGMVGFLCTFLVVVLALLTMASNHLVFAWHGVHTTRGFVAGAVWLHPTTLAVANISALIGIAVCTALCHTGAVGFETLFRWLRSRPGQF